MSRRVIVERDVEIPMRDGVVLRADVYRPDVEHPLPAILARLPYNKDDLGMLDAHPIVTAERGYAVVYQDTRGRYRSDGEFYPFRDEGTDGYDTVEWVADQPWCDGAVGMTGASYIGATLWLAAVQQPPHLKALFPQFTASDYYEGWTYQGGAFQLGFTLLWTLAHLAWETADRWVGEGRAGAGEAERLVAATDRMMDDVYRYMPLAGLPVLCESETAPYYFDWIAHAARDSYWRAIAVNEEYHRVQVPAYHTGGWYDIFLLGTLENYVRMRTEGGSEVARANQHLLVGPWGHGNQSGVFPELSYGAMSSQVHAGVYERQMRFFDTYLKGEATGLAEEPPVCLFVMGENRWRQEKEWPLARAVPERWYIHSDGRANTDGGTLSPLGPGSEPPDSYLHDPRQPTPTVGGAVFLPGIEAGADAGPRDHRSVAARSDVVSYTSDPLDKPLEVTGPLTFHLWAATSAVDTDFVVRLCDVFPDGRRMLLAEGVLRARFRYGYGTECLLKPGEATAFDIDLVATSNVFRPGHRIGVDISSSSWPRFDVNPNTGHRLGVDALSDVAPAVQTVWHSEEHASYIVLPTIG